MNKMKQIEIKEKIDLLNDDGSLQKAGFARHLYFNYDSSKIKRKLRIKEWDFYQIINDDYCLQMNIGHITYISSVSATLFNLKTGKRYNIGVMKLFQKIEMEKNGEKNHALEYQNKNFIMKFLVNDNVRTLSLSAYNKKHQNFEISLELLGIENSDGMVIATPFRKKPQCFYLNYKQNLFLAQGKVIINEEEFIFNRSNSYGLLDWGRGVWPYKNEWLWGSGTTMLDTGMLFSFNIGKGFGDLSNATENMLFLNGIAHKIEEVFIDYDKNDYLKDWKFTSSDHRLNLIMKPLYDNYTSTNFLIIAMKCHQVFGFFSGNFILDDGRIIEVKNMLGFCEVCNNRW
ncbi:MAG: DUF2804 domain-containing protein [Bacilli bacterium]|nr:DUF2804 domain-containing protein [Bacilli bacterium]